MSKKCSYCKGSSQDPDPDIGIEQCPVCHGTGIEEEKPNKMTRDKAIETIKFLYPPDSDLPNNREIGQATQVIAQREVAGWKTLPEAVLIRMAQLQIELESNDGGVAWAKVNKEMKK